MIYSNLFILQLKRPRIRDRKEKLFRVIEHVRRAEPDLDSISTLLGLILPENKTDYMLAGSPDTDIGKKTSTGVEMFQIFRSGNKNSSGLLKRYLLNWTLP